MIYSVICCLSTVLKLCTSTQRGFPQAGLVSCPSISIYVITLESDRPNDWFWSFPTSVCHLCGSRVCEWWFKDCKSGINCPIRLREVVNRSSPSIWLIRLLVLVGAGHIACHCLGPEAVNILFSVCAFSSQESVMLQFCGNKLDKKDFFGKSDPFLVFYRSNEDGSWVDMQLLHGVACSARKTAYVMSHNTGCYMTRCKRPENMCCTMQESSTTRNGQR